MSSDVAHDIVVTSYMNISSDVAHAIVVTSYIDMSSDVAHVIVVMSYMDISIAMDIRVYCNKPLFKQHLRYRFETERSIKE